ncbi:ferritin-like domain-containing protein [Chryseosolibacter indicus]|uniref:Ferritin-like domain-containing protein n=1 Tax=Chryseosolibacter indicus TaxID=2782351 RepID=A0ABS5VQ77_9BACT|nr:ferritin-like domain-containing protein [Chryseosolibacter indicus]MBT1703599.1 ferritin-like domain-containing protein [Chryseosolibacter indicus]
MAQAKTKSRAKTGAAKKQSARKPVAAKKTAPKPKAKAKAKEDKKGSLLEEFFMDSLKDIYWAEKALTKALPKMSKSATSPQLKEALDNHLEETLGQIERLEKVFEMMGKKAQGKKCEAMQGLVEEGEEIMAETKDDSSTRDAALIIAAQKVEHYEIATYGGLVQLAKTMNNSKVANVLASILSEEKKADELLTRIAEQGGVNEEASEEEGEKSGSVKDSILSVFSK